ncbi:MAG: hypothetical protein ACI4T2_01385 [Christensenellales bacterium]
MGNEQGKVVCGRSDLILVFPTEKICGEFNFVPCENAKLTPFMLNNDWTKIKNVLTGEIFELTSKLHLKAIKKLKKERRPEPIIANLLTKIYGEGQFYFDIYQKDYQAPIELNFNLPDLEAGERMVEDDVYYTADDVKKICVANERVLRARRDVKMKEMDRRAKFQADKRACSKEREF